MLNELFLKNRSYRRFSNKRRVKTEELRLMIESARLAASGANRQRIRYALVNDKNECDRIFSELKFAAYLKDWQGPTEEERPAAYVIFMTESENLDTVLAIDFGIAAEAILMTAVEMGLGGCIFRSFNKENVEKILSKDGYNAGLVIALGEPSEVAYVTEVKNGDIKYFRDEKDNHAVPKYTVDELII